MIRHIPKQKPFRSAKYRHWVADHCCCVCGSHPSAAHHHQKPGQGIVGGKVSDRSCLPLCPCCHRHLHDQGRSVWQKWGKDPEAIIQTLNTGWVALGGKFE